MHILHGPCGKLIKGHVLDCSERAFNEALRDYDSQLYTAWNPKKLKGHGCWEIRRKPNTKTAVYKGTHKNISYWNLEYVEFDMVHHVLDAAFLNYDAIRRVKQMDSWGDKNWADNFEKREEEQREALRLKAVEELKYNIKQHGSLSSDFYEAVRSGVDPARILLQTNWALK